MKDFLAGWCGGCAGVIVGQPLDTVKVRLQTHASISAGKSSLSALKCFTGIIKHETVSGLFKGMGPPLAAVALQHATMFGVYSNVLKALPETQGHFRSALHVAFAGSMAGLAQLWIVSPTELVKIRLQVQNESPKIKHRSLYKGPIDCVRRIYKTRGIRGLGQGITATALRDIPGYPVYFGTYELFVDWFTPAGQSRRNLDALRLILAGGMAGTVSWTVCFPLDVVKSRLQADGANGIFRYSGIRDCVLKSYREGGVGVFTRGIWPTVIRGFPTNAAIFLTYEFVLRTLSDEVCSCNEDFQCP